MRTRKILLSAALSAVALSSSAFGQAYRFNEVPAGLPLFGGPAIFSVNDKGAFLFVLGAGSGPGSTFIFDGRNLTTVPCNAGDGFIAFNSSGHLLGYGNNGPFLQDKKGNQTMITGPEGIFLTPLNLNNDNVLVGQASNSQNAMFGFTLKNGALTQYSYPNSSSTALNGNNDLGDAVGSFNNSDGSGGAFLLSKSGKTSLISVGTYSLVFPAQVNNLGLIVGYAATGNPSEGQVGFYKTKKGKMTTFDYTESAPPAMPGPKGPLKVQTYGGVTYVWGTNTQSWICGEFSGGYVDAVGGYQLTIPFVGKPGG
jgi:hypothetical protein